MTKRFTLTIVAAGLLFLLSACAGTNSSSTTNGNRASSQSTPDQFVAVRGIYDKDCKGCHGQTGDGGPVKLDDGTKLKVPSLREGHALRHTDAEYLKQITKGGDGMPEFDKKLTTDQMNDLIKFIRTEFQPAGTSAVK